MGFDILRQTQKGNLARRIRKHLNEQLQDITHIYANNPFKY